MTGYTIFRKTVKGKGGKPVRRYYYHWTDSNGKQHQKICHGPDGGPCRNRSEADSFIRSIPPPVAGADGQDVTVGTIAAEMYIPGSAHMIRREQFGKSIAAETMAESRRYIKKIIDIFGGMRLVDVSVECVMGHLFAIEKSGRWKNRFLEILGEVYSEAAWYKCRIQKPIFQRFVAKPKKADIFSTAELDRFFKIENFQDELFYLFFLLSLSAGLRLGEARAVRVKQIIFDHKVLIVDGFCKGDGRRTNYNKKGNSDDPKFRVAYLPDLTLGKMAEWIKTHNLRDDDYCFAQGGQPVTKEAAERAFHLALISAGFVPPRESIKRNKLIKGRQKQSKAKIRPDGRKLVPHSLRYTYVSRMRRDLSAAELQPMTGHASEGQVNYYDRKTLELALAALPVRGKAAADSLFV